MPKPVLAIGAAMLLSAGAAWSQTKAKAGNVPEIPFETVPNFLKMPRVRPQGQLRPGDRRGLYGFAFAHTVRVDPQDDVYSSSSNDTNTLDEGEIYKMELDGKWSGNSDARASG